MGQKTGLRKYINSVEMSADYSIVEVKVPDKFVGKTIGEIGFNKNYNVLY